MPRCCARRPRRRPNGCAKLRLKMHTQCAKSITADAQTLRETAAQEARKLRGAASVTQQETFLKAATLIIETLNSMAVDLQPVLEPNISDAVWRRFHAGDRGAFTRQLLQMQEPSSSSTIKKKFEDDPAFREHVLRYLSQFDTLLAQAKECDPLEVLGAAFVTADVGKLYLVLSRAVGRVRR